MTAVSFGFGRTPFQLRVLANGRLLESRRRVNGPEHPETLVAMNNLTVVLRSRGELDEAEALIRDCLAIRRRVPGAGIACDGLGDVDTAAVGPAM